MPHRSVRSAVVAVLGFALLFLADPATAQPGGSPHEIVNGHAAVAREVLVKFRQINDAVLGQVRQQEDIDVVEDLGSTGAMRLRSRSKNVTGLLRSLAARGDVQYVEPNYVVHTAGAQVPNEPSFAQLWGLQNTGQSIGGVSGVAGADIKAPNAWGTTTGSTANVVGVIDTGVDYAHPDLAPNMWKAPAPFSVVVGGQTISCAKDARGFNAIANTCDPMDDNNHGTHVSGTIGAAGNNAFGVAGVNWTGSIMGLKFLASNGSGSTSNAVKAIDFAIQVKQLGLANVRVLSNSWGGGGFSLTLLGAIGRARDAGMIFVAAAGNAATDNDASPFYPANYNVANVVAVAATDNRDMLASFSNYGASTVDLAAPGVYILSTIRNNGYAYFNGTSMATPHVSGAAALVMAACSALTTSEQVVSAILGNTDPLPVLAGKTFTGGRLNVDRAIQSCAAPTPAGDFSIDATPASRAVVRGGASTSYSIAVSSLDGFTGTVQLAATGQPAGVTASFDQASVNSGSGTAILTVAAGLNAAPGNYTLTITGTSGTLTHSKMIDVAVRDFSVSATPGSVSLNTGASASYTVSGNALNGFSDNIALSVKSGLPAGANATFTPGSTVAPGGSATLTITGLSTAGGPYTLTIEGQAAGVSRTTTVALTVTAPAAPSFTVTLSPSSRTVNASQSTTYTVTITPQNGFTGAVALSASGLPNGATGTFSPSSVQTSGTSTLTISTIAATPVGTYTVTATGTGGGVVKTGTASLTVNACKGVGKCK
jgi:subtilisin family serine protease